MSKLSSTEENYLKAIYKLEEKMEGDAYITTNSIAHMMTTKAASVTDMLKRLSDKELVTYQRYKGVKLRAKGDLLAKQLVRKHRLWEVFLLEKLDFKWDEVHDLAEQLEHISSDELTHRLDKFLEYPRFDPHGDPIPDADGNIIYRSDSSELSEFSEGDKGIIVGVKEHSPEFLRYLEQQKLILGTHLQIIRTHPYDNSLQIRINEEETTLVSDKVSRNLYVKRL